MSCSAKVYHPYVPHDLYDLVSKPFTTNLATTLIGLVTGLICRSNLQAESLTGRITRVHL